MRSGVSGATDSTWVADCKRWFPTDDGATCIPFTRSTGHGRALLRRQAFGDE